MRSLIIGDLHINERSIAEIENIFDRDIVPLVAGQAYDRVIQLGDWFDKNTPTPAELKFSSALVQNLQIYFKEVIILSGTGEHDILRGTSVVEHLEAIGKTARIIKGDFIENNILYGHFMVNESRFAFGTGKCSKADLSKYDAVFLGHQHIGQIIHPNIIHVGSIRYVTFNEVGIPKSIVSMEDKKPEYIPLTHVIPMVDVTDVSQLEQIDAHTKVRVIFNSFEDYKKHASYVNRLGKKFFQFKIKMNFEESKIIVNASKKLDKQSIKSNIIKEYIEQITDSDVRNLLEEQFKNKETA
jgi:DNA repair exonuclease SbcCD nuclease subunit